MINANCDVCEEDFKISRFNTFKLTKGVEKTSFSCPHCETEYVAGYTNKEIRELQLEIKRVRSRIGNTHGPDRAALIESIDSLVEKNTNLMQALKETIAVAGRLD